jgi:1-acyl-sn-glycerol-3-phosphate acyltransferase
MILISAVMQKPVSPTEPTPGASPAAAPPATLEAELPFTTVERVVTDLARVINETPLIKKVQSTYLREFGRRWVRVCTKNLVHVDGLGRVAGLRPDRGVLLCANHRSFFDSYVVSSLLFGNAPWMERVYFPVRSNFFYDQPAGAVVNAIIGGMAMYPPIYRDAARRAKNDEAVAKMCALLEQPGTVIGMHPEGTRSKTDDPYTLLPAQPGVGQIILKARPIVLPVFINGLLNDLPAQVAGNFRRGPRRGPPIVVVFGDPLDLDGYYRQKPRAALYKKVADHVVTEITALGARERELRAQLAQRH